jgi:hypothetical protein
LPADSFTRIGLLYTHKEILAYEAISSKMVHVFKRICKVSLNTPKSS